MNAHSRSLGVQPIFADNWLKKPRPILAESVSKSSQQCRTGCAGDAMT
jgi:hypothetical protein